MTLRAGGRVIAAEANGPAVRTLDNAARKERHQRGSIGIAIVVAGNLANEFLGLKRG
jgi:hypothetical protein